MTPVNVEDLAARADECEARAAQEREMSIEAAFAGNQGAAQALALRAKINQERAKEYRARAATTKLTADTFSTIINIIVGVTAIMADATKEKKISPNTPPETEKKKEPTP